MAYIRCGLNKFTLVDDEDYDYLNKYKWFSNKQGYVYCKKVGNIIVQMHRMIMQPCKDQEIDHKNGNPLDNRKCNLRYCTRAQNCRNTKLRETSKIKYKGVSKIDNGFMARIRLNYIEHYLGYFKTKEGAAKAYDRVATKYHGEFAKTNKMLGLL